MPKDRKLNCWCPAILTERGAGPDWHMWDATSLKWGVTSLQLVRFSGAYKTDCSEATVWNKKTWSQFTKHNLFQALCGNKQSSSAFSNAQTVRSSVLMGAFSDRSAQTYLNAKSCIHKYCVVSDFSWHHEVQSWKDCDPSANTRFINCIRVTLGYFCKIKTFMELEDNLKPVSNTRFPRSF